MPRIARKQIPQGKNIPLYELLTSEVMAGAVIEFPLLGLTYEVGWGWRSGEHDITASEAHEQIRRWWSLTHGGRSVRSVAMQTGDLPRRRQG